MKKGDVPIMALLGDDRGFVIVGPRMFQFLRVRCGSPKVWFAVIAI